MPSEHGGWGLTAEPALLGLAVAPSTAGGFLGAAALLAFVARTPLKVVLVDTWRHQRRERTSVAIRVLIVELGLLAAAVVGAAVSAEARWWWPALVAGPLVAVELWFDMRSRSRRLVPELAGAVGIGAVAAMIVLADDGSWRLAVGVWLVLAARAVTAIPHVRTQVARLHGRSESPSVATSAADLVALAAAATALGLHRPLLAGSAAIGALVAAQRLAARAPVPAARVLGLRQMVWGLTVVIVTALGVVLVR